MKKYYLPLFAVSVFFFNSLQKGYSQCAAISTTGTHCDGQRAIFPIPATAADEELEWYQDAGGTVSDGTQTGPGNTHVSRVDVTAGQTTKDFWIRRKTARNIGPASGTAPTGTSYQITANRFGTVASNKLYEMQMTPNVPFTLNSLNVWVKAYQPATVYGLRVRVVLASEAADLTKGTYSDWYKFGGSSNPINAKIPANLEVPAGGPYLVQVISETNAAAGVTTVDEMYYEATATNQSYLTAPNTIALQSVPKYADNSTTGIYPKINNWDITVNCPLTKITSTVTTTGCCVPVKDITLTPTSPSAPATLNVTGPDALAANYYEWYDELGRLLTAASGQGKTSLAVTDNGSYRVKVYRNTADKDKISCYKDVPVILGTVPFSITAQKVATCVNGRSQLKATTDALFVGWTTLDGEVDNIETPTALTTWVSPTVPTMYLAKARYQLDNLVKNGDFEGTGGYTSDYDGPVSTTPGIIEGKYAIGTNPNAYNPYFVNIPDHTPTGVGNMYIVDANANKNLAAYRTSVPVEAGVTYAFSFWIANIHNAFSATGNKDTNGTQAAKVQFVMDGKDFLRVNTPLNNGWTQYVELYTATANKTIDILVRNNGNANPAGGNDFALDDIVFAPVAPNFVTDTVWVNPCIPPCNPPTTVTIPTSIPTYTGTGTNKTIAVCAGTGTLATLNGAYTSTGTPKNSYQYAWYKEGTSPTYVNTTTVAAKTLTAADSGTWVLRVEDYNGSLSSASCYKEDKVKLTVTARPTFTVGTSTICGGSVSLDTLVKNLKPATSTLLFYTDTTAATPTPINKVVTATGKYFVRATGPTPTSCTSKFGTINVTINPKPAKPTITVDQTLPFCVGNARNLTAASTTAGATFQWSGDGTAATAIQAAKTTVGTSTYIVQATANGCKSDTTSVKVTLNPLPTASITGSGEFCKEATPSLALTLTGKAPFTLSYTDYAGIPSSSTPTTTSDALSVPATVAGPFTLTKIADANGCSSTPSGATAIATVTRTKDLLITNPSVTCNFATKEATVKFDVTDGKPTYSFPTPIPSAGAFAAPSYTAKFLADGSTPYDYRVSDVSACTANTNLQGPKGSINCACPVTGVIDSVAGSNTSICNDGVATTKIKVTVANSNETSPVYDFVVKTPTGTLIKAQGTAVGNVYTFDVKDPGVYTIQSVGDQGCQGSGSGSVTVKVLPDPKATITATDPTYCKDGVDKGTVTVNITNPSKASYTVVVSRTTGGDTTLTLASTTGTITSGVDNTFTLKSLTDASGCSAKVTDLTGSAVITGTTPPVAVITAPVAVTSPSIGSYTFNTSPFTNLVATDPGAAYVGAWAVSKTSGTGTPELTGSNSSLTNGIKGMSDNDEAKVTWTVSDPNAICTVPAVATINLIRKPITEALAKNDTICISAGASYFTLPINLPNSAPGVGEDAEWIAVGSAPAPEAGKATLSVSFTAPGSYQYTYRIFNPNILDGAGQPIESKNTYTIVVDDIVTVADADTTNESLQICSTPYSLKANWPKASKGETGLWTGGVTFVDPTQNVSNITGLTDGSSYPLTWTIYSKYKVCPSSSDNITYIKLKDITKPFIDTIPDVCVGTTVNLKANKADGVNNETGTWTTTPGGLIPVGSENIELASLSSLAKGTYTVIWTITSTSCKGGTSFPRTFKVDDKPTLMDITAVNPDCEGKTGDYTANGASAKFAFDLTYKWSTTSASLGVPTRNFIGTTDQPSSKVEFISSPTYLEELDSATVVVELSNACGTATATTPVIWRLKPRKVGVIGGPSAICGSSLGSYTYGIEAQSNATIYNWRFAGDTLTNIIYPGPPETDSTLVRPSKWAGIASPAIISLRLENTCGKAADSATKSVVIISPDVLKAVLTTNSNSLVNDVNGSQKVCLPKYPVTLNAFSPNAGTDALYTYYVDGNIIAGPTANTSFQISRDSLTDGSSLWVKVSSQDGCFISTSPGVNLSDPSNTVKVDGYAIDSTLTASSLEICDGSNQSITLSVPNSKGNTGYAWSKDGASYSAEHPLVLTQYEQSGRYHVVISNSVCPSATSKDTTVRIYDLPNPEFVPSPFVIYYDQNSTGTVMPLITEGTRDTLRYIHYNPDFFLSTADSLRPIIKTESQEFTQEYELTIATGPLNNPQLCPNTAKITVINALPLRVPNAFSPNNDGKNDTWVIDGLGKYKDLKVNVYNRWGNSMFTDKDGVYVPWDGTTNGAPLASGTYYYVLELKGSPDGTDDTKVGSLTIVR